MYSDKAAGSKRWILWLLALLLVAALSLALASAARGDDVRENSAAAIKAAVESGAKQCYAVEGVYPPDLKYLEDNYGLKINTDDFYVVYDIYASNIPPTVKVVLKGDR